MRIRGLYYNHTFTYEEINSMIESILFSKTIDTESANKIIEKLKSTKIEAPKKGFFSRK